MSEFFTYVPQTTNAINQVATLADEVNTAFLSVESIIEQDTFNSTASIASSIGNLDNSYIKQYLPNNPIINNYQQTLIFPPNSQEAGLDLFPSMETSDLASVSVYNVSDPSKIYTYQYSNQFTAGAVNQFCFIGRKIIFSAPPFELGNQSNTYQLNLTYNGYNPAAESVTFDLRFNVLIGNDGDGGTTSEFTYSRVGNTYTISGQNFLELCSTSIQNMLSDTPENATKYISIYNGSGEGGGERINCSTITLTSTQLTFTTTDTLAESKVKIYVANSSIGTMIGSLFELYYAHNHGDNGGNLISHGNLLGLFENTYDPITGAPIIEYHDPNLLNFEHPQYLNRSGYIDAEGIYNNAMVGDLLISSKDSANRYNNLDSDSYTLRFGEFGSGHKIYYSSSAQALIIESGSTNGVNLVVSQNHPAFSINSNSFTDVLTSGASPEQSLHLALTSTPSSKTSSLKQGILRLFRKNVDVVGSTTTVTEVDEAKLFVNQLETNIATISENGSLIIGDDSNITFGSTPEITVSMEVAGAEPGIHFAQVNTPAPGTPGYEIYIDMPLNVDTEIVNDLCATNIHIDKGNTLPVYNSNASLPYNYKLVFGAPLPNTNTYTQNISYDSDDSVISISSNYYNPSNNTSTPIYTNVALNGYRSGISLDKIVYQYVSSDLGIPVVGGGATNHIIENTGATYFLKNTTNGTPYTPGVNLLSERERSNVLAGDITANNLIINNAGNTLGDTTALQLGNSSSIFSASNTTLSTFYTICLTPRAFVAASSYIAGNVSYGEMHANKFYALPNIGDSGITDPSSGYYGNVWIPPNYTLNIQGDAIFANALTFNNPVTFDGQITATNANFSGNVNMTGVFNPNSINCTDPDASSYFGQLTVRSGITQVGIGSSHPNTFAGPATFSDNMNTRGINTNGNKITGLINSTVSPTPDEAVSYALLQSFFSGAQTTILNGLLGQIYPIGTVYINADPANFNKNPKDLLGFSSSTWVPFAKGRALVGTDPAGGDGLGNVAPGSAPGATPSWGSGWTATPSINAGKFDHTLNISEMPSHTHQNSGPGVHSYAWSNRSSDYKPDGGPSGATGGDQAHNNVQPSTTAGMWIRVG